jgi:hypothetical protein
MNKFRLVISALAIAMVTLAFASLAQAQATRTWVSGVGDDVNPCSRTAPCKTFAGAISKTANKGEINVLDPGGFGAVTITKAITIDAGGGPIAGVLVNAGNGIIVNALSSDTVVLRNLDINGLTTGLNGIRIIGATSRVHVENCQIYGFTARGISDERTNATGQLFVQNTSIHNTASAVVVIPGVGGTVNAALDNCRFQNNSSAGVGAEPNSKVTVSNSVASGNGGRGFVAEGAASAELNLQNCISSHNSTGVAATNGATVRISNTQITNNTAFGIDGNTGGLVSSYGNNNITANGGGVAGNTPNGPPIAQQ